VRRRGREVEDPRRLQAVGLVFVVLSAATAIWQWASGRSAGALEFGMFTGGLIVVIVTFYLARRRRHQDGGT
jgi:hypothetical protein